MITHLPFWMSTRIISHKRTVHLFNRHRSRDNACKMSCLLPACPGERNCAGFQVEQDFVVEIDNVHGFCKKKIAVPKNNHIWIGRVSLFFFRPTPCATYSSRGVMHMDVWWRWWRWCLAQWWRRDVGNIIAIHLQADPVMWIDIPNSRSIGSPVEITCSDDY